MHRTPLNHREMPDYTRGEEIMNMVTHIAGGGIGVVILVACIIIGVRRGDAWAVVSGSVYGASLICLFAVSSIYHGLKPGMGKRVMQVIDHCTIYFFIAGTYTPILLVGIRQEKPVLAWVIFGLEWGFAALGITLNAIDLKKYKVFSMICYLAMGWLVVFTIKPAVNAMTLEGFWWLLSGGIFYTVGAILYGVGKKIRYVHSVFHIFVNIACILQAVCVIFYVMQSTSI